MRFGAHVPTRGRLALAVDYAQEAGCDAFQVFVSNPRGWAAPSITTEAAREFAERRAGSGLGPAVAHASYLVNIASPDEGFRRRSVELARAELQAVAAMGADGLVVHAGAGGPGEPAEALARAAFSVLQIVGDGDGPPVLLELTAGGAGAVASTIPQASALVTAADRHPRVALCLDTCHLFAAGYPLHRPEGATRVVAELREHGLLGRLGLLHANDARDPCGSRRDRHADVGQGFIGEDGFRSILGTAELRGCAALVETPGRLEDHRRNVEALRRLAA